MNLDPVYRIGAGAPDSAVVLHVPHGSRELTPLARSRVLLDDAALETELDHITDAHTDLIAVRAASAAGRAPWLFVNRFSRLVVDPERFPDEREEMRAVGMGAVYTRTSHNAVLREDDPVHEEELLARHFRPYAEAVADLVDARLAGAGRAVLIDVHSYPSRALPYELHGTGPRPAICLGTDPVHTPSWLTDAAMAAFAPCGTRAINTPFAGCYVPLRHYLSSPTLSLSQPNLACLMVEIRRDVYLIEPGGPPTGGIVGVVRALTDLVDSVT
jgi:N-formylglutamate deformylase